MNDNIDCEIVFNYRNCRLIDAIKRCREKSAVRGVVAQVVY